MMRYRGYSLNTFSQVVCVLSLFSVFEYSFNLDSGCSREHTNWDLLPPVGLGRHSESPKEDSSTSNPQVIFLKVCQLITRLLKSGCIRTFPAFQMKDSHFLSVYQNLQHRLACGQLQVRRLLWGLPHVAVVSLEFKGTFRRRGIKRFTFLKPLVKLFIYDL